MSARVLVVDDILPNVKLLEAKLSSEYYDVITATSGAEALEKVVSENPDIVLLDVMMPIMDGFEVCHRIKSNPLTAHIPVVMVTALTDSADRVRGLEAGADDFLSKPVNDVALMARVRSLVRLKMTVDEWRTRENTAQQLGVGDANANFMSERADEAMILVIEDQSFECDKILSTLDVDQDIVHCIPTGMDAFDALKRQSYDLIMVSLNLANEDGLRLCSHLRSNEKTRAVPILMMGYEEDMSRIAHGLEIGAHDYILRPTDRNELLARARTQIRRKRFQDRLRNNYERSLSLALTDTLTGLYNRRYFDVHIQKLLDNAKQNKKDLGILMFDIDHFKSVNDTHGHNVGDEVLKVFAARLMDKVRSVDLLARLGGEEFVAVLPEITVERTRMIAERLRRFIAEEAIPCSAEGGQLQITTSIGGVIIKGGQVGADDTIESILKRVDDCLYTAKKSGRNMCVFEDVGILNPDDYQEDVRIRIE